MRALVREVSPDLARCELTHLERVSIDSERARREHRGYTQALQSLGCELEWLAPLPDHADGVFVEDTAVVLPELAVISRPGAASRRGETETVSTALGRYRRLANLIAPACLEGGDVLHIGRTLFVGVSGRTNAAGVEQLAEALAPHGYRVQPLELRGCLHLKSACTFIAPETLLVNPDWVDAGAFGAARVIRVDPAEPYGANTLTIAGTTLVSTAFPRTVERLRGAGVRCLPLEVRELHKAESALTCMSLIL
jgi:dimethylargininase